MNVTVVGGGVSGLGAALALARRGHDVTVVERDHTPMPTSADEAFAWDRRGAPQVRHSHAFLGRLVLLLRNDYPDVYADLLAEGATELPFGEDLPPEMVEFAPEPADAELTMLACRRTTFEWVVRRAAIAEGRVTFRTGVAVDGLLAAKERSIDGTPIVTGVRLADRTELKSDLVVVASGRRSAIAEWLTEIGAAPVSEQVEDTGIVYFSRFYRLRDDAEFPPRSGVIGGDLGYLKYAVFVGDNRTFSITLAVSTEDTELRRTIAENQSVRTSGEAPPFARILQRLDRRERREVVDERDVRLPRELEQAALPLGQAFGEVRGVDGPLLQYRAGLELDLAQRRLAVAPGALEQDSVAVDQALRVGVRIVRVGVDDAIARNGGLALRRGPSLREQTAGAGHDEG